MKLKLKFIFPLVAGLALSGCSFITITDANQKEEDTTVITGSYYKGYDLTRTGGKLIKELQRNCWEKHTKYIAYGQFNSYCAKTSDHGNIEATQKDGNINQLFYTGKEQSGLSYTSREHVWPCANSSGLWVHDGQSNDTPHNVDYGGSHSEKYVGGGSDLYHVRLANTTTNSVRGNTRFVSYLDAEHQAYASGVTVQTDYNGKWALKVNTGQKTCEPANEMKGDVARIVLYVFLHYTDRGDTPEGTFTLDYAPGRVYKYSDMVGSLSLISIMGYDSEDRCKEVLSAWNKLDPPSTVEKERNNTVQKIQGNRNPFVDFPDLVDKMFGF